MLLYEFFHSLDRFAGTIFRIGYAGDGCRLIHIVQVDLIQSQLLLHFRKGGERNHFAGIVFEAQVQHIVYDFLSLVVGFDLDLVDTPELDEIVYIGGSHIVA